MSATITQRPYQYSPVNNPVVYKFAVTGGPFTLYRLVIGVYKESDDSLIGEMSKSPDLSGNILADVSSILKNVLYRDWGLATLSEDQIGSIRFYIKYQEFYTGSATSPIDDVGNQFCAVIASLQIRSNADLDAYVLEDDTKKFLTKFDTPSLWRGYPFSLSYLMVDSTGAFFCWDEYSLSGALIKKNTIAIVGASDLQRAVISATAVHDFTKTIKAYLATGLTTGLLSAWANGFTGYTAFGVVFGQIFAQNPFATNKYGAYYTLTTPLLSGVQPENITLQISGFVGAGSPLQINMAFMDGGPTGTSRWNIGYGVLPNFIEIPAGTGAFALSFDLTFVPITAGDSDTLILTVEDGNVGDSVSILFNEQLYFVDDQLSEVKTILVKDPCENPIYLFWKNTLGGDAFWLFDGGQELTWQTDERKAKQLLLFAENITENEFDAINEVNTPGIVYQKNVQELTTSIDRTSEKTDQQLFVIETDGSKIGVINLNRNSGTRTRQVKHIIDVSIEYPELFL